MAPLDRGLLDEPSDEFKASNPDWGNPAPTTEIPITWYNDIEPILGVPDIIEDVLARGAMSVIYGESNSGKTFFACTAALHAAFGQKWFDLKVQKTGVIYVALEGTHGIMNRVSAFKRLAGQNVPLVPAGVPFGVVTVPLEMCQNEDDTLRIIDLITTAGRDLGSPIGWIIMDTLARAMGSGNENASEDMGALVRNGDKIRSATGAHISWIHHSGKDQAKGARGHSSLRAATDTEIEVTKEGKFHLAKVTKQRDFECKGEFEFKLKVIELGEKDGKKVTSCALVPLTDEDRDMRDKSAPKIDGKNNKDAYTALKNLIIDAGTLAGHLVPIGCRSVLFEDWRQRFYGKTNLAQESRKKAFQRAEEYLISNKIIGHDGGRVWFADDATATERDI